MKRFLSIILVLVFALSLCACDKLEKLDEIELPPLPTQTPAPTPVPTKQPEVQPSPVTEKPESIDQVIVNTVSTVIEEFDPAEGKELILSYRYDTPVVYIEGKSEASEKINSVIELLDETHYTGNDHGLGYATGGFNMMLEQALDNYGYVVNSGVQGVSLEYTASRTAEVERADSAALSIAYHDYYYTGGAHGIYFTRGYTFDTQTGEQISLEQLSKDGAGFKTQLVEIMLSMAENDEEISGRIDSNVVPEENRGEAFANLLREGSWYFNDIGLCIFSDVYEIGSYAQGEVVFNIPYDQLQGKMDEKWFPAQRSGEAKLSIDYLDKLEDGSVEIIDRVVADEGGSELYVMVEGIAYNVKLSSVDYTNSFYETAQHWYASYVQDSALQLVTILPEGMPNLMLSYNDADGNEHRMLITQSGQDGSLQLVDDSIQAVG